LGVRFSLLPEALNKSANIDASLSWRTPSCGTTISMTHLLHHPAD